jgi:hypothetical protein
MQTLENTFHNTSIRIKSPLDWEQIVKAAYYAESTRPHNRNRSQINALALHRRIRRALCGMTDCHCGTVRH